MIIDQAGILKSREVEQKHVEDLLSRAIIQHQLSFSFVEPITKKVGSRCGVVKGFRSL